MKHLPYGHKHALVTLVWLVVTTLGFCETPTELPKTNIWEDHLVHPFDAIVLSEQQIDRFLLRLSESSPARSAELQKIRITHPQQFRWEIRDEMANRFFERVIPPSPAKPKPPTDVRPPAVPVDTTQKRYTDLIVWLETNFPQQAEDLKANPAPSEARFDELFGRYEPVMRVERSNPPLAEAMKKDFAVQMQCDELLLKLLHADEQARKKIIRQLDELTGKRFDLIILKRQLQYDHLQRRLERLSQELDRQKEEIVILKSGKDVAVKDRVKELVERADKADWD